MVFRDEAGEASARFSVVALHRPALGLRRDAPSHVGGYDRASVTGLDVLAL